MLETTMSFDVAKLWLAVDGHQDRGVVDELDFRRVVVKAFGFQALMLGEIERREEAVERDRERPSAELFDENIGQLLLLLIARIRKSHLGHAGLEYGDRTIISIGIDARFEPRRAEDRLGLAREVSSFPTNESTCG